ncbi:MAG: signal peptidase I [Clostridia bacterium]|nr:signal peptidase I [Clostridia bacterium]
MPGESKAAAEARDTGDETAAPDGGASLPEKEGGVGAASVFDWVKSVLLSFAAVIFVFTVLFRGATVVGTSMKDTLHNGERVIVSCFMYTPKTGDIVVLQSPNFKNGEEFLIKRVIAVGGQTVRIDFAKWEVSVDGVVLQEDYVLRDDKAMITESIKPDENGVAEFVVEKNCVFVMGDNRNDSLDSRSEAVGQVDQQYILGKVILRYLPFNAFGPVR